MMRKIKPLSLCLCAIACVACSRPPELKDHKVENIIRIFAHEPGHWTVFTQAPGSKVIEPRDLWVKRSPVVFYSDVPPDQGPWILLKKDEQGRIFAAEFHLRSIEDLHGVGFRISGKPPTTGQTTDLERDK